MRYFLIAWTLLALPCSAQLAGKVKSTSNATLFKLPQVTPSVVFPGEQATVLTPANGAALTTALTGVACGTTIRLAHGVTYSTGTAFPLTTNCTCRSASNVYNNSQWIIIESDQYIGGSVRGTRIDPSAEYGKLAYISSTDTNYAFTATNNSAGCYWLLGLDVLQNAGNFQSAISIGDSSSTNWVHDIVIDHSYVHGTPTENLVRCIVINGTFESIVDSYLSDCHKVGQDSQGIAGWDGPGVVLIQNNFIEGATENFIMGGSPPQNGILAADFTIQNNHFFKPLSWRLGDPSYAGIHWSVKNLFENKNIQRELITANVFQNNWEDSQNGMALLFDAENASSCPPPGPNPLANIRDVTFYYNILQNSAGGGQLAYSASNACIMYQPVHRFYFHDNLFTGLDECQWGHCGSLRPWLISTGPPGSIFSVYDAWWVHETISAANESQGVVFDCGVIACANYGLQFRDSINTGGAFGFFFANGGLTGNAIITNVAPGANFTNLCNVQNSGADGSNYSFSNFNGMKKVANYAAVFVNPGTDWHVAPTSDCYHQASDGLSMGANIDAVNAATAGVVQTLSTPVTVTNISPSTFTHLGSTSITISGTGFLQESGLGVIIGGAGPSVAISSDTCGIGGGSQGQFTVTAVTDTTHFTYTGGCVTVTSSPITLVANDTINITNAGNVNRYTPGNACTSVMVVSPTSITCNTPAASGAVTTGPVSIFVSQWGIPVQSTVFGTYN